MPKFNLSLAKAKKAEHLTRPVFKTATSDGYVVHSDIPVRYKDGEVMLSATCDPSNGTFSTHEIYTQLIDSEGKKIGFYSYMIDPRDKTISNGLITTRDDLRHRGLGEIMRLSSLMELKENFISAIKIDSLPTAIPFHAKYKFKPDLSTKYSTIAFLQEIAKNDNIDSKTRKRAEKIILGIRATGFDVFSMPKSMAKKANKFVENFIKNYSDVWELTNLHHHLPMILTGSRVKHFSKFYNKLFKKHGIDYTI